MGNEPIYTLYSPLRASFCTTKYQLEPILRHILTSWRQFLTIKITLRLIAGVRGSKWVIVGTNGVSNHVSYVSVVSVVYVYVLSLYVVMLFTICIVFYVHFPLSFGVFSPATKYISSIARMCVFYVYFHPIILRT